MTPYEIDVLLHYYSHVDDHEDIWRWPPIWEPTTAKFLREGVLERDYSDEPPSFKITERGRAYVNALQRVPLPEQRWLMPEGFRL